MPIAFWRDEYCTGDFLIDSQHQYLFQIINRLHDSMLQGHGRDVLNQTLNELVKYTIEHFHDEERIMRQNHYPRYAEHKQKHDELTQQVKALQIKQHQHKDQFLAVGVSHFLTEWLIHHIKGEDQQMIKFFQQLHPPQHQPQ